MARSDRLRTALRGEKTDTTPIWIMRQAGRYLPEYRATRAKAGTFLTLCKTPELACEVTLQPIERLGVDAAILFSDILIPIEAMGVPLHFTEEGPRLQPVRSRAEVDRLRVPDSQNELPFVCDAVRLIRRALDGKVPLIGFSGAPFTLLTYVVEGQTSKQFVETRKLLFSAPDVAHALLQKLADTVIDYLAAQICAGAEVVQLFDSWIGQLSGADFRHFALPYLQTIVRALAPLGAPIIYFANDGTALLADVVAIGSDALSVDWRLPLDQVRRVVGAGLPLQGNLDPGVLYGSVEFIEERARDILDRVHGTPHIFNLGHGIFPDIDPGRVGALVDAVHRLGAAQ